MGSIAKATRRIGYDLGFDKIGEYLAARRKKKEDEEQRRNLYQNIQNAVNSYNQRKEDVNKGIELTGNVTNPFMPERMPANSLASIGNFNPESAPLQNALDLNLPVPQTRKISQDEKYQKGKESLSQFYSDLIPVLLNQNADQDVVTRANAIGQLFGNEVEQTKPEKIVGAQIDPAKPTGYWKDGKFEVTGEPVKKDAKESIVGSPTNMGYWTDRDKDGNLEFQVNPHYQEMTDSAKDNSLGWANYNLSQEKYLDEKKEKSQKKAESDKTNQTRYNSIMNTPYLSVDELIQRLPEGEDRLVQGGILREEVGEDGKLEYKKNYGGAYYYVDENNNVRLFPTEEGLQNFANQSIPNTPDKWKRTGYDDIKQNYNSLIKKLIEEKKYTEKEAVDLIRKNEGIK